MTSMTSQVVGGFMNECLQNVIAIKNIKQKFEISENVCGVKALQLCVFDYNFNNSFKQCIS